MMMMLVMTFERKANSYMMTQPSLFPFASNNVGVPSVLGFVAPLQDSTTSSCLTSG